MPEVPPSSRTGAAPGKMNKPPGARLFAATEAAIDEVHTDCLRAKSTLSTNFSSLAFPPHQPPATLITAGTPLVKLSEAETWAACSFKVS